MIKMMWDDGADQGLGLPSYETPGAAGADLRANFADHSAIDLEPGARALIPTGLRMEIPQGFEVQIRPRSGLALKQGLTLLNTPGTIDSDYRGPIGVIMINHGAEVATITHGMRIAQMVVAPVVQMGFAVVNALSESIRGSGGFGSTGT
ncbi:MULTISPECIES: dUTP diphosphatase [unclassified Yoonia]|uniref:dUTP diphosphatase n=1 Tax=unclassified Yoonia TaxID=2629118 RepID=UPI002AFF78B1|nr:MULTISPECIES: dUTP diphosphatase [unclassified Yoonia]